MIITLDANKPQENSLTPRNEFKSEILNINSSTTIKFKLKTTIPTKEVTIFQIMNMDVEDSHIPIIRLSFLDINSLYITYKDENFINHYTKIANYEIGKVIEFKFKVSDNYIEVAYIHYKTKDIIRFWRFERPFNKYKYKCGLYSQTDEGLYELELIDFTMKTLSENECDNNEK